MATKKDNIKDMVDSKQAPGQMGSKKKYFVDHKTLWDGQGGGVDPKTGKPRGCVLVTAESVPGGRRVIETSDSELQKKLEKRGYIADTDNKVMHSGNQPPTTSIKSAEQVEKENR